MDWKCLEGSVVAFRSAIRAMPASLPAALAAALQQATLKRDARQNVVQLVPSSTLGGVWYYAWGNIIHAIQGE